MTLIDPGFKLDQQRVRTQILIEAEQGKLKLLQQTANTCEVEAEAIYDELITEQEHRLQELDDQLAQLTHQLEGPALRERLHKTELSLRTTIGEVRTWKLKATDLEQALKHHQTKVSRLSQHVRQIRQLNEKYVAKIAELSLHQRQNIEDHAQTVLTISHQLLEHSLDVVATASSVMNKSESSALAWATHPDLDQTIFAEMVVNPNRSYVLALIISVVTPDQTIYPIEIKVTELSRDRHSSTRLLYGFSTAEAIDAADIYAETLQKLQIDEVPRPLDSTQGISG